jgi:hypothetical protein
MSIQSIQSIKDQMTAMEQSLSQMRLTLEALTAESSAKPKTIKIKTKAEPSAEPKEAKEPKAPSAWNLLVQSTVADMKHNGWESWTDLKGVVWPASRRGPIKDKSGAQSEGFVYDGGENDGKSPSPALGGMVRASYLKVQSDPEAAAKQAAKAAIAEKRSAASSAAAPAAEPKKAGRPKMTPEQKAAAAAKRAEKASAPESGSESAAEQPKKAGRPKMTPEHKAAAAAKRAEKKAEKAKASASDAESVKSCESGMPDGWAELMGEKVTVNKKLDLSFYPFTYNGQKLVMNDRGDVIEPEEGIWMGRLVNGLLDEKVPEPEDLEDNVMMRA